MSTTNCRIRTSKYILHTEQENKQKPKNERKELSYGVWNEFFKASAEYHEKIKKFKNLTPTMSKTAFPVTDDAIFNWATHLSC